MLSKKKKKAIHAWEDSALTEFSEAPILVRAVGMVIVAISTVFALLA
jgi:hypothetical protein